jgi:dipeptidyl aminopeptidase/acylaminoacyl peptidase
MAVGLALALSALLLGTLVAISYGLMWRVTRPGRHTYWDEYTILPSDMDVPYTNVEFSAPDGLPLAAWQISRPDATTMVVMASGYRDRKTSMLSIAAGLYKHGLNVFLLDFRNQGDSGMDNAQTMGWREIQDMLAAVDLIAQRHPQASIGAMGWSMGAVVSLFAAAQDTRVKAVVADSAYADQTSVIASVFSQYTHLPAFPFVQLADLLSQWRAGYRPSRVRPLDVIDRIAPRPLMLIHGEEDDLCAVENAHRLYARAGGPKELWLSPKAKHVGAYFADPDAYIARVAAFFHAHLT